MNGEQKRFRITVPAEDVSVLEWIAAQQNVSYSIRQLIRDYIQKEGMTDATCHVVRQLPRRGRPPKELETAYADVEPDDGSVSAPRYAPPQQYEQTPVQPVAPVRYNQTPAPQQVQPVAPVRYNQTQVPQSPYQPARPAMDRDNDGFVDPSKFFG